MPRHIGPPVPRAQAVADELRTIVKERRLLPGDQLPSELELVTELGVGRSSVREGVQLLESLGIVKVEQGKGTFLASPMGGGLRRVIEWAYGDDDPERLARDLFEARFLVETELARLAAMRATDEEIEELQRLAGNPDHVEGEASDLLEAGLDYHHQLARLAHNDILLIMSNAVRPLFIPHEDAPRAPKEIAELLGWHTRITAAIARRDPDAAAEIMREHLEANGRSIGLLQDGDSASAND